jgi:hypothetical protein
MFVASACSRVSKRHRRACNRLSRLRQRSGAIVAGFGTWQGQQRAGISGHWTTADQYTSVWAGAIASDNCTYRKWPVAQPGLRAIELSREFCLLNDCVAKL